MPTAPLLIVKRDDDGSGVANRQICRKEEGFVPLRVTVLTQVLERARFLKFKAK